MLDEEYNYLLHKLLYINMYRNPNITSPFPRKSTPHFRWRGYSRDFFEGLLDLSGDFLGLYNNLKIRGIARVSQLRCSANKVQPNFLRLGYSAWDFLGVNSWSRSFFWVFYFCPHSIISVTWNPEYPAPPPPRVPIQWTPQIKVRNDILCHS